jgi:hypothetical protein
LILSGNKKFKVTPSAGKIMATVFRDCQGIVMIDYLNKGSTVTGEFYANLMHRLRDPIKVKRRGKLSKGVLLLHDNAPVHLIKGIRNNFLYKNLIWNNDEGTCTAKWKDIENAYMIDGWSGEFSAMPTLTDQHVIPAKINKMKVAFCTQVFTHTVAAAMRLMAKKRK